VAPAGAWFQLRCMVEGTAAHEPICPFTYL
jgi:hypothetical protein